MKLQCPHCKTVFQVDESDYAAILAQVRNSEFEAEITRRLKEIEKQREAEAKAARLESEQQMAMRLADKDREKAELEKEIERLKGDIGGFESEKKAALAEAEAEKKAALAEAEARKLMEVSRVSASKDKEISRLQAQIDKGKSDLELALLNERNSTKDELHRKEQAITELNSRLEASEMSARNKVMELNERHTAILKAKEEEIERYKEMKSRLSTKMLGETLEQHCHNMFNRARSQGQFIGAYFEKDNDASHGSKGDFIFRDYVDGDEYISIMFEMKNEDDKTATKHKNEDFFAKLDKDRREKNCEYAVLVTMLEADNDFYNEGIVDVSYRYPKMLVVRPQFFMAVIHLLSNSARRGAERLVGLRRELEIAKAQSVDVTKFEQKRDQFVANFAKLVEGHHKKQDDALTGLDKAIEAAERQAENLRKIKTLFEASRQKLIKANESAENDFTIKKLTHGNPTMRAKFEEARKLNENS